jgi:molybdenum cofactor cytidylyltransferase
VMLADMVHVTPEMVRTVVATAQSCQSPLVASQYGEVIAPPLLFRRALFPELLACQGEGWKQVVQQHRSEAVMVNWPTAALADVDTPEDWERLR